MRKPQTRKPASAAKLRAATGRLAVSETKPRLYTLDVCLISGPYTRRFAKANPVVCRTIKIRGDQTLQDLHHAIFAAFNREQEHFYEFQFGKGPMDPEGPTYILSQALDANSDSPNPPAGTVEETTIGSLGLGIDQAFGYWFDYGDDWWHQINVVGIEDEIPPGKYPRVAKRVGKSPPQYADLEEDDEDEDEDDE